MERQKHKDGKLFQGQGCTCSELAYYVRPWIPFTAMRRRIIFEKKTKFGALCIVWFEDTELHYEDGVVTARTAIDRYSIWINTADLRVLETHLHVHDSWSFTKLQRQTSEQFFKEV